MEHKKTQLQDRKTHRINVHIYLIPSQRLSYFVPRASVPSFTVPCFFVIGNVMIRLSSSIVLFSVRLRCREKFETLCPLEGTRKRKKREGSLLLTVEHSFPRPEDEQNSQNNGEIPFYSFSYTPLSTTKQKMVTCVCLFSTNTPGSAA